MKKIMVSIVILLVFSIQIISMCIITDNASASSIQYIKLYQHVETEEDANTAWLDTLRLNTNSANRIKIAENAVNIDWEISYPLTPALQSDLLIHRGTNYYIHQFLESDSTANNVEIHVHFEGEDGSPHWAHKTDTKDITSTGISFTFNFTMGELDEISPNDNIQLRVNVKYTGLPRTLYLINENDRPSGISIPVKNPLNVDISAPIDEQNETVTVMASISSPFGDYHIDKFSYTINWNGPTTPVTVSQPGESEWQWDYGADSANPGLYKVTITASDIIPSPDGPNSVSSEKSITISKSSGDPNDETDDKESDSSSDSTLFLGIIGIVIIVIVVILVILMKRKKE